MGIKAIDLLFFRNLLPVTATRWLQTIASDDLRIRFNGGTLGKLSGHWIKNCLVLREKFKPT